MEIVGHFATIRIFICVCYGSKECFLFLSLSYERKIEMVRLCFVVDEGLLSKKEMKIKNPVRVVEIPRIWDGSHNKRASGSGNFMIGSKAQHKYLYEQLRKVSSKMTHRSALNEKFPVRHVRASFKWYLAFDRIISVVTRETFVIAHVRRGGVMKRDLD